MDWPLIGAVSAVTIVAGVVTFEAVVLLQPDPAPGRKPAHIATVAPSVDRSAYDIPGFASAPSKTPPPSFPLIPLIDPNRSFDIESPDTADRPQGPARETPAVSGPAKAPAPSAIKQAKLATPELSPQPQSPQPPPPPPDKWTVLVTSKASYFNLGGHVDKAGIVDSLASSHLRDAFKAHRNFARLPPEIRTHILTQDIDLPRIAPYRGLLGINDKTLEEEQAVRFVRVANNR